MASGADIMGSREGNTWHQHGPVHCFACDKLDVSRLPHCKWKVMTRRVADPCIVSNNGRRAMGVGGVSSDYMRRSWDWPLPGIWGGRRTLDLYFTNSALVAHQVSTTPHGPHVAPLLFNSLTSHLACVCQWGGHLLKGLSGFCGGFCAYTSSALEHLASCWLFLFFYF